jgi:6-phosphogluconate dehydrogenase
MTANEVGLLSIDKTGGIEMSKQSFGLIGLAVMGENLALNIERNGFPLAVYNRTGARTKEFVEGRAAGKNILPTYTFEEFVGALERPRKIMLMVKAGAPVDEMLAQLKPHLKPGDLVIDGGNSFYKDTERRAKEMEEAGFLYIGTGVSGGEEGALHGPSIMPGGQREAYQLLEPIFKAIAAKVNGDPCVTYIGPRGSGHYVKMVHNGIEYGDMQLIAESYDIMSRTLGLSAQELYEIFTEWNKGELSSYLIEITADIFTKNDEETGRPLVDVILDEAQQKGTGKWTSQDALDIGAPIPTITAAVESRIISAYKEERMAASKVISGPGFRFEGLRDRFIDDVRAALFASKICSYAQGMALLRAASQEYDYNLNLGEIARIWRGGCIIRAQFLNDISAAFNRDPNLKNLLLDPYFKEAVESRQNAWRSVVRTAVELGIPCLAMSTSLAYFDAYRSARLPANLTQAQRDYFGAHTYRRIDKEGSFHAEWQ